jgi:hypothetical protein
LCAKFGETNCGALREGIFLTWHDSPAGNGVHYNRTATADVELSTTSQPSSQQQLFLLIFH